MLGAASPLLRDMYAIIETGGKQYWVTPGETLKVERLPQTEGAEIVFPALWASSEKDEGKASAAPSAKVTAQVLRQGRDRKVLVFKKRPKSHYRRSYGHRQAFTEIRIKDIALG